MFEHLLHTGLEPFLFVSIPQKRIYWLFLLSSAIIACGVILWRRQPFLPTIKKGLSPSLWLSRSSLVDFQWFILNHLIYVFLLVPIIGSQLGLAFWFNGLLHQLFGTGNFLHLPPVWLSAVFTFVFFISEDFTRFLVHYLHHRIPILWRFHAIHHSADVLTPVTLYRIHTFEMLINSLRSIVVAGIVTGLFIYLFDEKIRLIDILGANIFAFLFNLAGANLRHSSVWLGFGKLEKIFVSPAQHQIHHSAKQIHFDKNMGSTLAIWDRLFGTWVASKGQTVERYGISEIPSTQNIFKQLGGLK